MGFAGAGVETIEAAGGSGYMVGKAGVGDLRVASIVYLRLCAWQAPYFKYRFAQSLRFVFLAAAHAKYFL